MAINYKHCMPVFGFNSKQWWVYDNEHSLYIDPTVKALELVQGVGWENQEKKLKEIIEENPDWLQDEDYFYSDENFEI